MNLIWTVVLFMMCIHASVIDIKTMRIPNKLLGVYLLGIIALRLVDPLQLWWSWSIYLQSIGIYLLLFIPSVLTRGGLGGGDVKLFAIICLIIGFENTLFTIGLSLFIGIVVSGIGVLVRKLQFRQAIPFAPIITIAIILQSIAHQL